MKKRLLVVSLFLISILFVSSCAQMSKYTLEDKNSDEVDVPVGTIFVTSEEYEGDMGAPSGGIDLANKNCNKLARAAGLKGQWVAMLSTSEIYLDGLVSNILPSNQMFYNMNNEVIANSVDDLFDGELFNPILYNELGEILEVGVWTGSYPNGSLTLSCDDWTEENGQSYGTYGFSNADNNYWLGNTLGSSFFWASCDWEEHIYCLRIL